MPADFTQGFKAALIMYAVGIAAVAFGAGALVMWILK